MHPEVAQLMQHWDSVITLLFDIPAESALVQWLGRIKTDEAKELAVGQLPNPGMRIQAMRALVRQKATGVRDAVAAYLDNEHEVFRKEARKTLDKLPED
jgi:hypothetical protein